VGDARLGFEEGGGFVDGHGKHLADVFLAEGDFQRGGIVALAVAGFAMDPGGGEEIHFQLHATVAFAFGAASAVGVEGKAGDVEAAHAGFGELGEERADVVEDFHIGRRAGTRGFADGRLIDFEAGFNLFLAAGLAEREVGFFHPRGLGFVFEQRGDAGVHQRGFAGTGNSC